MNTIWTPQPKQAAFLRRGEYECLYGGAAGGGKSDALLMEALRQVHIPHYRAILFRKTFPQLAELIDRSQALYPRAFPLARYNETKHLWRFPSGAQIAFGSMQHPGDRLNYQGRRYDFIGFDELTHFSWEEYSYMFSRNRPSRAPGATGKTRCYIRATANPGGIGHGWVKARFIDPAPPMTPIREEVTVREPDGSQKTFMRSRVFVPATVYDNEALLRDDPEYVARLALLPPRERSALLYGDWDSYEGQYFAEFRQTPDAEKCRQAGLTIGEAARQRRFTHVIAPFDLSSGAARGWKLCRSYDFGYAKPRVVGGGLRGDDLPHPRALRLHRDAGSGRALDAGAAVSPHPRDRGHAPLAARTAHRRRGRPRHLGRLARREHRRDGCKVRRLLHARRPQAHPRLDAVPVPAAV